MCIIPKSFRHRVKRLAKDYFRLYRSTKPMAKKLTEKQIKYAIKQCSKDRPTSTIAKELNVTQGVYSNYTQNFARPEPFMCRALLEENGNRSP